MKRGQHVARGKLMGAGSSEGRKGGRSRSGRKAPGAADSASHLKTQSATASWNKAHNQGRGLPLGGGRGARGRLMLGRRLPSRRVHLHRVVAVARDGRGDVT